MLGLYLCPSCEKYYAAPKEFDDTMENLCKIKGYFEAAVQCECGTKHHIGGENWEDGICLFGGKDEKEHLEKLLVFKAVMLEECKSNDPNMYAHTVTGSIYNPDKPSKSIYLRPKHLLFGSVLKLKFSGMKRKFKILNATDVIEQGDITTPWLFNNTGYFPYDYCETLRKFEEKQEFVKLMYAQSIGETPSDEHIGRIYLRPI